MKKLFDKNRDINDDLGGLTVFLPLEPLAAD
jgi:hypothetical protein